MPELANISQTYDSTYERTNKNLPELANISQTYDITYEWTNKYLPELANISQNNNISYEWKNKICKNKQIMNKTKKTITKRRKKI